MATWWCYQQVAICGRENILINTETMAMLPILLWILVT